jgi:hypothetical protein
MPLSKKISDYYRISARDLSLPNREKSIAGKSKNVNNTPLRTVGGLQNLFL